nr:glycerophosphodiester phosphodiesterase [Bacteroidia bacterium]
GCKHDVPNTVTTETKIIAHRGFGLDIDGVEKPRENTLNACLLGFKTTAGIEVDVQRTNDHEVFLFHDARVPPCEDFNIISIGASTKPRVLEQFKCLFPDDSISHLQDLLLRHEEFKNKDLFIDVKSFFDVETIFKMPTPQHYLNLLAQDVFALIDQHPFPDRLHIETENAVVLNAFKKHYPRVNTWLVSYGDVKTAISRAFREHYTGLSIKDGSYVDQDVIDEAHEKGLEVAVWVVNERDRLDELVEMRVDYVQTDSLFTM